MNEASVHSFFFPHHVNSGFVCPAYFPVYGVTMVFKNLVLHVLQLKQR